jgi:hypothetical protein
MKQSLRGCSYEAAQNQFAAIRLSVCVLLGPAVWLFWPINVGLDVDAPDLIAAALASAVLR